MDRVMIIGQPGSGKSTLARAVGQGLGLPVVHIDRIHYRPGWDERTRAEKLERVAVEEAKPRWVIEGALSATYANRIARAELLIWLDRDLGVRLRRVLARAWRYRGRTRPDLPENCPESFGLRTLGFVGYILRTSRRNRAKLGAWAARAEDLGKPVVRLSTDEGARQWLEHRGLPIPEEWESEAALP